MRKRIWLLSILALLILCTLIIDTYGLFETNSSSESEFNIGRWIILLNDADISLNRTITLDDFTFTGNQHIENGYFAPGGSGTLDITIDATDTDVAVEYTIEFDTSQLDDHPNITLSITDTNTNEEIQGDTFTGTMLLTDDRELDLTLAITWTHNDLYNENDSELIDNPISIPVDITFSQLINENE